MLGFSITDIFHLQLISVITSLFWINLSFHNANINLRLLNHPTNKTFSIQTSSVCNLYSRDKRIIQPFLYVFQCPFLSRATRSIIRASAGLAASGRPHHSRLSTDHCCVSMINDRSSETKPALDRAWSDIKTQK